MDIRSQGYEAVESVVYQDNQSSILLEKNGRLSSGNQTRHINNISSWRTELRLWSWQWNIGPLGTGEMIADFFTKPLQGKSFKNFGDNNYECQSAK
jgi:hypothetical protein